MQTFQNQKQQRDTTNHTNKYIKTKNNKTQTKMRQKENIFKRQKNNGNKHKKHTKTTKHTHK